MGLDNAERNAMCAQLASKSFIAFSTVFVSITFCAVRQREPADWPCCSSRSRRRAHRGAKVVASPCPACSRSRTASWQPAANYSALAYAAISIRDEVLWTEHESYSWMAGWGAACRVSSMSFQFGPLARPPQDVRSY
eukprot:6587022-Prymnesium_polylepis.2